VLAVAALYIGLWLDWQGRPFCHKQFYSGFMQWREEPKTNAFPNVNGSSLESLLAIREEMGFMGWTNDYHYVPGLREADPGQLVLMYFNRPTRWTWHGDPPNRFTKKAWLIVPLDFQMGFRRTRWGGECSERLTTEEFKQRLRETLDFVRTNERPNWQKVVEEHSKFLEGIK
jgi:hypothetical protein